MSESDTMFNERGQRCTAVQLMPSTNPSYDNRTIASTLKMQIWTVQCLRACIRRPFGSGGVEAQGWGQRQEDPDQGVHWKGLGNHWWNSPVLFSLGRQFYRSTLYIYIYIYTRMDTDTHTHKHTRIYIYIYIYLHLLICLPWHIYTFTYWSLYYHANDP